MSVTDRGERKPGKLYYGTVAEVCVAAIVGKVTCILLLNTQ